MDYFPVFLDLKGRRALVVGGGETAFEKAMRLRHAGAAVGIIAPRLSPTLARAAREGEIEHLAPGFARSLLDGAALVIVADECLAVREKVAAAARARGIPVNVVDDAVLSSCIMPAIVERPPITFAIATGGRAPLLATLLKRWLDARLPLRLGTLAILAGHFRPLVRRKLRDPLLRRRFWERVFGGDVAALALAGEQAAAGAALAEMLAQAANSASGRDRAAQRVA
ncbi:MAG TPA: bifunctional precorrin-2 dehydrogenase/sirohydrochlorin ferrochelatase [Stellaceae bacterium]|nr:bifunctional precorrin-2 dehydrogenase/sirohydrochlorin ferrochelatase [Stellaceae bacterium]